MRCLALLLKMVKLSKALDWLILLFFFNTRHKDIDKRIDLTVFPENRKAIVEKYGLKAKTKLLAVIVKIPNKKQ